MSPAVKCVDSSHVLSSCCVTDGSTSMFSLNPAFCNSTHMCEYALHTLTLALCECVISRLSWESIMFEGKTTFLPEASRLLCVTANQLLLCCLIIWLLILITASWRNRRHFTAGSWIIMHQANKAMQHISSGFPLRTRASQRSLMKPSWHRQTACRCWTWATTCWMSILL